MESLTLMKTAHSDENHRGTGIKDSAADLSDKNHCGSMLALMWQHSCIISYQKEVRANEGSELD